MGNTLAAYIAGCLNTQSGTNNHSQTSVQSDFDGVDPDGLSDLQLLADYIAALKLQIPDH